MAALFATLDTIVFGRETFDEAVTCFRSRSLQVGATASSLSTNRLRPSSSSFENSQARIFS
jgi:hypothetical protein